MDYPMPRRLKESIHDCLSDSCRIKRFRENHRYSYAIFGGLKAVAV